MIRMDGKLPIALFTGKEGRTALPKISRPVVLAVEQAKRQKGAELIRRYQGGKKHVEGEFKKGDLVATQDRATMRWSGRATVVIARKVDRGRSYVLQMKNGNIAIRSSRHMRPIVQSAQKEAEQEKATQGAEQVQSPVSGPVLPRRSVRLYIRDRYRRNHPIDPSAN